MTFNAFFNKFKLSCNFLQYFSPINSIPQSWKKLLHSTCDQSSTAQFRIEEMTCKRLYTARLLSLQHSPPPTCEKRLITLSYQKDDLGKLYTLYLLPFKVTKEVKLSMFQFKIIHNIMSTKSLLFKMNKEESLYCPFCPADHTIIIHLFTECAQATSFWKDFLNWFSCVVNSRLVLSKNEIVFGIINIKELALCFKPSTT